jgi:hypothetical protein
MAQNYRHIPAVRQQDEFACWAACMKWWKKAVNSVNKSQQSFLDRYVSLTSDEGGMTVDGMRQFIRQEGLNIDEQTHMDFTVSELKDHLAHSPLFIAFVESTGKLHVNVVYELVTELSGTTERYSQVRVMEPQSFVGNNWKGKHEIKSFGTFTWFGNCMIGSLKP